MGKKVRAVAEAWIEMSKKSKEHPGNKHLSKQKEENEPRRSRDLNRKIFGLSVALELVSGTCYQAGLERTACMQAKGEV
jgi:hypothetical protein